MFTSLGYISELERAAEQGNSEIRSRIDLDEPEIRQVVRREFPEANSIVIYGDPKAGAGGLTYVFSVNRRESKYVLKFAPEGVAENLKKGVGVYRYLSTQTEVPVPAVHTMEPSNDFAYPYTIVEHVEGDEISDIPQFKSFSRERKKGVIRGIGHTLGKLHEQTQFGTYGSVSVQSSQDLTVNDSISNWRDYYLTTYEEYADTEGDSSVRDLAIRAREFFEQESHDVTPNSDPVLLHADFTPDNLITEQGSVQAVLDWELARAGCSAEEFWEVEENVVHLFQTEAVRNDLRDSLYEGYREIRSVSETFLGMKSLFAVGEFTRIGNVHSVLSELDCEFDAVEFRTRAERELDARIQSAEFHLEKVR